MKKQFIPILLIVIAVFAISACSVPQRPIIRSNDVIRIDSAIAQTQKYASLANSSEKRNSYYLEGTVLKLEKRTKWLDCPPQEDGIFVIDTFVVFLDKKAKDNEIERISIKDIILVGPKIDNIPFNEYENKNYFERSNDPFLPNSIRGVRFDSVYVPCPEERPCPCNDFSFDFDFEFDISCPKCEPAWWFFELSFVNSIFLDFDYRKADFKYRNIKHYDIAAGLNFNKTQIGLLYNPFFEVNNYYHDEKENKPLLALFGKQKFDPFFCMNPYIYGLIGTALDKSTLDYIVKKNFLPDNRTNCISNFGFPLSYGFGLGVDVPIPSCLFNFFLDIGYRSLAIGQRLQSPPLDEQLFIRRLDLWNLRIGIRLGNK